VVIGGLILAPSLGLLFRLVLAGGFDPDAPESSPPAPPSRPARDRPSGGYARLAGVCAVAGVVPLTVLEGAAAHAVGVVVLLAGAVLTFAAVSPDDLAS
jgi:hypothetical protein